MLVPLLDLLPDGAGAVSIILFKALLAPCSSSLQCFGCDGPVLPASSCCSCSTRSTIDIHMPPAVSEAWACKSCSRSAGRAFAAAAECPFLAGLAVRMCGSRV